jgi:ABC-type dipeptide/oligopeptide/nickel transport system permease subunit
MTSVTENLPTTATTSKRFRRVLNWTSGLVLAGVVGLALMPRAWLPKDPIAIAPALRFQPPAWIEGGTPEYLLGTDALGRDVLTQMMAGARATLLIVAIAALISLVIGVTAGLVSGHFGGWVDSAVMRLVDVQLAFPVLVLIIAVIAVFGPSVPNLILVLGLASWAKYARLTRGMVLGLREKEFVEAAWASGGSHLSIIFRHYLPNVATSIVIFTTFEFARLVLVESALSFLGLGVQPPTPSWGRMISEARQYLFDAWWASALPGLLIVLTVLSFNLMGDELRDRLDPHSSGG